MRVFSYHVTPGTGRAHHTRWICLLLVLVAVGFGTLAAVRYAVGADTTEDSVSARQSSHSLAAPEGSGPAGVDAGLPTPLKVEVREPTEVILVYSVPPADPTQDGTVFVRVVDPKSVAAFGEDRLVGSFMDVDAVRSNSPDASPVPRIIAESVFFDRPLAEFTLSRDGVSLVRSIDAASVRELRRPHLAVIGPQGATYRAEAKAIDAKSIVATNASGGVVSTYPLPRALPITSPEQLWVDGRPEPGAYDVDALDAAESLLISGEGHLLVFVDNIVNSALVDLSADRRLDLPGYGYVAAATVGQDGYVYAVLLDGSSRANRYVLAQIDPKSMELKQLAETTVRPSEWRGPIFISLVATPGGDIFFYATLWNLVQDPDVYAHTNVLLQLDRSAFQLTPIAVPDDLGQRVSVGVDGKIYIYGGPAESTVSVYDPSTGQLSRDLPELRSPPGTYIRALFVR